MQLELQIFSSQQGPQEAFLKVSGEGCDRTDFQSFPVGLTPGTKQRLQFLPLAENLFSVGKGDPPGLR